MDLSDLRREYRHQPLDRSDLKPEPIRQFEQWFQEAREARLEEANAMSLATVDEEGRPFQRMVLLKYFDEEGFVFFSNYESRKARHIARDARVSLLFFWKELARQVHLTGWAQKVSAAESVRYFASRPRGSQLGAWVSQQSSIISSRQLLLTKFEEMKAKFRQGEVPLPAYWGGYRVQADSYEFWQGRENRLHDRFLYRAQGEGWRIERLAP
jgi:pyridoxamine 5'-phosphate oxidase